MRALPEVSPALVRRLALASLVGNVVIVTTGGAVRLTKSGLGCPTWPRCTDESYVPTDESAYHTDIEFGNRTLTFVLGLVMVATLVAIVLQRPRRRSLVTLSVAALLGIPAQAVIGGITVHTDLNPWTVAAHFLASMVLVALTTLLWHRSSERSDAAPRSVVRPELLALVRLLVGVAAVTLVLGTLVTGSGPHAGDEAAARTGFDPATIAQLHADVVMLLVGLTFATWLALRATGAPQAIRRAAVALVVVELSQGLVGYTQYFTDLPIVLVGLHMLGACLVWIAALRVLFAARVRDVRSDEPVTTPPGVDAEALDPESAVTPEAAQTQTAEAALGGSGPGRQQSRASAGR